MFPLVPIGAKGGRTLPCDVCPQGMLGKQTSLYLDVAVNKVFEHAMRTTRYSVGVPSILQIIGSGLESVFEQHVAVRGVTSMDGSVDLIVKHPADNQHRDFDLVQMRTCSFFILSSIIFPFVANITYTVT